METIYNCKSPREEALVWIDSASLKEKHNHLNLREKRMFP